MGKQTGITGTLTVADGSGNNRTFSGDVTNWDFGQTRNQIDVTGIDKSFFERLPGLGDYTFNISGVFNATAQFSHDVFSGMGTALRAFTLVVGPAGTAVGTAALASYTVTRAQGGALTWAATLNCANGTAPVWS